MNGEIFFDMTREDHPLMSGSKYIFKRWKKYTIYSKSGSYVHTDNPSSNLYMTNSIYLYDYVVVSKNCFNSMVYTQSMANSDPLYDNADGYPTGYNGWVHEPNTFKNTSNLITNNYYLTSSGTTTDPSMFIYDTFIRTDKDTYFEIVKGYPRNHFNHKRDLFSLYNIKTYGIENKIITSDSYFRNRQTIDTTIGSDGLEDGSSPVQTVQVGNLNLVQTDNVINH